MHESSRIGGWSIRSKVGSICNNVVGGARRSGFTAVDVHRLDVRWRRRQVPVDSKPCHLMCRRWRDWTRIVHASEGTSRGRGTGRAAAIWQPGSRWSGRLAPIDSETCHLPLCSRWMDRTGTGLPRIWMSWGRGTGLAAAVFIRRLGSGWSRRLAPVDAETTHLPLCRVILLHSPF